MDTVFIDSDWLYPIQLLRNHMNWQMIDISRRHKQYIQCCSSNPWPIVRHALWTKEGMARVCMFPLGSYGDYKGLLKIASLDQVAEFFRFSTRTPSILARVGKAKCKWCTQKSTSRGPLRNPLCLGFPNQLQPVKCEGVAPTQESNLITTYGSKARLANRVKENLALYGRLQVLLNTHT